MELYGNRSAPVWQFDKLDTKDEDIILAQSSLRGWLGHPQHILSFLIACWPFLLCCLLVGKKHDTDITYLFDLRVTWNRFIPFFLHFLSNKFFWGPRIFVWIQSNFVVQVHVTLPHGSSWSRQSQWQIM